MGEETNLITILEKYERAQTYLLPLLHHVQSVYGFIDESAMIEIAAHLNLSRAEVYGVVSFYDDFRTAPPPKNQVKICLGEACIAQGARKVYEKACKNPPPETEVSKIYCLGLCSRGPAAIVNDEIIAEFGGNE